MASPIFPQDVVIVGVGRAAVADACAAVVRISAGAS